MHACGHDAHTAIGMGIAQLLAKHRGEIAGTIKFVFQPGEEGCGGALAMIADGVLDNPTAGCGVGPACVERSTLGSGWRPVTAA